jgi:hypothetical protein
MSKAKTVSASKPLGEELTADRVKVELDQVLRTLFGQVDGEPIWESLKVAITRKDGVRQIQAQLSTRALDEEEAAVPVTSGA